MINTILPNKDLSANVRSQDAPADIRYTIFCLLWAIAALFHLGKSRLFATEFHYALLTFAAIFLLTKPSSIFRLLVFVGAQLLEAYIIMPRISNHWLFSTLVNVTILHALIYLIIKNKSFNVNRTQLLNTFAPLVRIELFVLYFFTVFHKLNTGFFNPATSCATDFFEAQNTYGLLPSTTSILLLNAYGTIIIETLIPVLLCFRKTRNWGLLIGLVFHCVIAYNPINGFFDFSSAVFALYFLFAAPDYSARIYKAFKSNGRGQSVWREKLLQPYSFFKLAVLVGLFLLGLVVCYGLTKKVDDYFRFIIWTVYSFGFIGIFMLTMFRKDTRSQVEDKNLFSVAHMSLLIIPVLIFLNGTSPYLGFKTENSFAMFSNLRTEGGISNHLVVPASVQVFNYQKDLVEIVASSDPRLQEMAKNNKLLVYFRFKNYVAENKPARVVYLRNGQPHEFNLASASPKDALLRKSSYWQRKFLNFRLISKYEPQPCSH